MRVKEFRTAPDVYFPDPDTGKYTQVGRGWDISDGVLAKDLVRIPLTSVAWYVLEETDSRGTSVRPPEASVPSKPVEASPGKPEKRRPGRPPNRTTG